MADNFTSNAGSGGDTFGADDISGVKYPRSKIIIGADGTNDGDVSAANPMPVTGTVAVTNSGLTELAAAINGSSQLDVNIAAQSGAITVASHAVTNAGTFAVQVDGSALTALQLIDDVIYADDAAFTAASSKVVAVGGIVTSDSVDSGDVGAFAMLANRQQKVTLYDSSGNELSVGGGTQYAVDAALGSTPTGTLAVAIRDDALSALTPVEGDAIGLRVDANGALWVIPSGTITVASHAVTNAGTFAVQVDGSALTALQKIDDPVLVDDAAFTPATSSVMMSGFQADESSTDSVDEGDAGAARMTLDRKVIVTPQPHTGGGLTTARSLDLDESEEEIKGSAGQVYGWNITNFATSTRYVKFYNATAASVSVGTTTPLFTLAIPGNATDDTMLAQALGGMGIVFDTAITWAATTGLADNDTGAPSANDVAGTVWYK